MPRSLWNGTITVGVIAVPVKLYTAVESKTVHFREVHLEDEREDRAPALLLEGGQGGPVRRRRQGLRDLQGPATSCSRRTRSRPPPATAAHVIDVESFVETTAIDPVFYDEDVLPRRGRRRAATPTGCCTTRSSGPGAPASAASRSTTASTWPRSARSTASSALHTMRFADELVGRRRHRASTSPPQGPAKREVEMAGRLVGSLPRSRSRRAGTRTSTARRCST